MRETSSSPVVAIMDDEQGLLDFLSGVLKEQQIGSWAFGDGLKALESIKDHPLDLVITDLNMRGFSGLELLDTLKQEKEDLSVIIMTGCVDTEAAVKAVNLHTFEILLKPLPIQHLSRPSVAA